MEVGVARGAATCDCIARKEPVNNDQFPWKPRDWFLVCFFTTASMLLFNRPVGVRGTCLNCCGVCNLLVVQ